MFFNAKKIVTSIKRLENVHPFLGITFLACKQHGLPIGKSVNFQLDAATNSFLKDFHRISRETEWFYQPFKSSGRKKKWVRPDYAAKGLQAINTQTFRDAFIHERNTSIWGWSEDYIDILANKFTDDRQKISAVDLAVWIYKFTNFASKITPTSLVQQFFSDFEITDSEHCLFILPREEQFTSKDFQSTCVDWEDFRKHGLQDPPDAAPEQGGILSKLSMNSVGPLGSLEINPAQRLSLITGDNGLGKTFVLDAAWWALTGMWAGAPAYPAYETSDFLEPEIRFAITGASGIPTDDHIASFDFDTNTWLEPRKRQAVTGLSVYARVDGSFSVWDPIKHKGQGSTCNISSEEVWKGHFGVIGGLITDWVNWQSEPSNWEFQIFCKILKNLSPPDLGPLIPGTLVRIPGYNAKIPTISHTYGNVPIVYASAGVRRIMALAYLIVWTWSEHRAVAASKSEVPQNTMVVLIDELEAHLHPKWQRQFLPALIDIPNILNDALEYPHERKLNVQFIIATHSPLVMASSESIFHAEFDKLFHLELDNGTIVLDEHPYINQGDISAWLESPAFGLRHAYSTQAEQALEEALSLQSNPASATTELVQKTTDKLRQHLAADDSFWPRWVGFAAKFEVEA